MNYLHEIEVNGKTYKLKLATRWAAEAEKLLGKPILEAVEDIQSVETCAVFLWAGLQKFNHGFSMAKTYDLMDDMIDEGNFDIAKRIALIMKIIETGGFFTEAQTDELAEKMETAMENAEAIPQTETENNA